MGRNRNYRLLWSSQALSEFGFNAAALAFPLLVLAVTNSAAASGLVLGTIAVAQLVAGLPAGALVDRWNRKKVMLVCEAAQALAAASLVATVWWGVATVAHMVAVAAVIGVCAALFQPAEEASLPNLVPAEQLSTAVAMNSARASLGHLSGTAVGGFLFAVGRVVPFAVDAVTHTLAFFALAFVRMPPREVRPQPVGRLGREMVDGLRWVWQHRHIRVTALCAVVLNVFFSSFYIIVIVLAQRGGAPSGEIGVMAAMLGVGGVVGSLAAPYLHRMLSPYASIISVFWVLSVLTPLAVLTTSGYVMGALFFAMALLPPTANTAIATRQLLLTPDELRGRLSSVLGLLVGGASALGPMLGGVLTEVLPGNVAILICAGGVTAVTLVVTVSPTLRTFPRQQATQEASATA
ncbi:MFS transporter [Planosporangium flavigriseum]|uniref:MFS transporter n=1 Tax=Planosporangium flavigriseum TaxID=373681 RepID=A0A8J3PQ44_9ACTN|nr:MFS transporter [Planosporangium flavigriseum]GIG76578.1 MFS transporter [Planosporangium flavigriseum]